MKPKFEKVWLDDKHSFKAIRKTEELNQAPWHVHPEFEIVYMLKGFGNRFIGDHAESFSSPELIMVGGMIPHYWIFDSSFYSEGRPKNIEFMLIQFDNSLFKKEKLELPEFENISKLLQRASMGLKFGQATTKRAYPLISMLLKSKGISRYSQLLKILDLLGLADDSKTLTSHRYVENDKHYFPNKIDKVLKYVVENLKDNITLETIASKASMNKSAFCRYFKQKMGKSFSIFIQETRINYACKLLVDHGFSISQIMYESGFNSPSHFNHVFKRHVGCSPCDYRKGLSGFTTMNG